MSRTSAQHGGAQTSRSVGYYADPQHPGSSRHRTCFPGGLNPKRAGYQPTNGPCWVCDQGTQDRTNYLAAQMMLEGLEVVAGAMMRACEYGFRLAIEIRCGVFNSRMQRSLLEETLAAPVSLFREAWDEAAWAAQHPRSGLERGMRQRSPEENINDILWTASAYGLIGFLRTDQGLSEYDPRRLLQSNPSLPSQVEAAQIETASGHLGWAARIIMNRVSKLRIGMATNRGSDPDEILRQQVERHGASSQQIAEAALTFLEPSPDLDELKARAQTLAVKLRQRKLKTKPLPSK